MDQKAYLNIYTKYLFKNLKIISIDMIQPAHIEQFVKSINKISKYNKEDTLRKSSSIHRLFSTIRGFHQYLYQMD